jgi:hypothetical protein
VEVPMKISEFLVVVFAAVLFLFPILKEEKQFVRQEQVEESRKPSEVSSKTYKVVYEVPSPNEEHLADIFWLRYAAEVAIDSGTPYFNILKQSIRKNFSQRYQVNLTTIEGLIELEYDPMKAEYDAHEIEGLFIGNSI